MPSLPLPSALLEPPPRRSQVWLVDADPARAERTARLLAPDHDVECFVEGFGEGAGGALGARLAQGALPDVLLLDWGQDGAGAAALCRRLRREHDPLSLPVLARAPRGSFAQALEAGAHDCIQPEGGQDALELGARLGTLVRLRHLAHAQSGYLASLFEQAPAFIAHTVGAEHVFDMANTAYLRLIGNRPVLGRTFREALPELAGQPFYALLDRVFATGEAFTASEMPARLDREADGRIAELFVNFVFQPTRSADGRVRGILLHAVEVTELVRARRDAEAAQRSQAGLLQALAAQSLVFVAIVRGPELVFEVTNSGYRKLFGNRELVGKPLLEAAPELRGQGFDALIAEVIATGRPFTGHEMSVVLEQEDGALEERLVSFVYQPVLGAGGVRDGVLITGTDVTEAVRARQEAQQRLAFEERLIGIVGHDLRSPLAAVRMSAAQLSAPGALGGGLSEAQGRAVQRVDRGARRIQAVITSLLDLTRARSGRGFPVSPAEADLDVTARGAMEEVRATHPAALLRYTHRGDTRGLFDEGRLAQVAVNLLENALKYGAPATPVHLVCEGDARALRLSVHNAGTPIAPALVAQLFQPFVRGPQSVDTVRMSVGLGLYIVREIVHAHGGQITVASNEAEGTTFRVELPRAPRPSP